MDIKKIIGLALILFSSSAYAVLPGPYIGIELGHGTVTSDPLITGTTRSTSGFAGALVFGGDYNKYFGYEISVMHFPNISNNPLYPCGSVETRSNSLNILGKVMYSVWNFSIFGKGGVSILRASGPGDVNKKGKCTSDYTTSGQPMGAIGVSYDLTQTLVADISFNKIFSRNDLIKSATFVGLGITYHFVDVYCGQFIC